MNDNAIIRTVPAAGSLHQVPGFDPLKHLKRGVNDNGEPVMKLDLPYKRLWFRLACPNGRLLLNPLRITDQMAIFEAQVFFQREDTTPASSFTSTKTVQEDRRYIRSAQDEALSIALDNAGFGIQLCDVAPNSGDTAPMPEPKPQMVKTAPAPAEKLVPAPSSRTMQPAAALASVPPKQAAQAPIQEAQPPKSVPASSVPPTQAQTEAPAEMPVKQPVQPADQESAPAETVVQNEAAAAVEMAQGASPAAVTEPVDQPEDAPLAEAPAAQEKGATVVLDFAAQKAAQESGTAPTLAPTPAQTATSYTDDMSVEEICQRMTVDEAMAIVVEDGICKGWTLGQVLERRRGSLKFFTSPFCEFRNTIKAAATLLFQDLEQEKAG